MSFPGGVQFSAFTQATLRRRPQKIIIILTIPHYLFVASSESVRKGCVSAVAVPAQAAIRGQDYPSKDRCTVTELDAPLCTSERGRCGDGGREDDGGQRGIRRRKVAIFFGRLCDMILYV